MRIIKFRAWSESIHIFYETNETMSMLHSIAIKEESFDSVVFEQFTGLLDRNGKEIFEGDILRFNVVSDYYQPAKTDQTGVVEFKYGSYSFGSWCSIWCHELKIIGNIHENPELTK